MAANSRKNTKISASYMSYQVTELCLFCFNAGLMQNHNKHWQSEVCKPDNSFSLRIPECSLMPEHAHVDAGGLELTGNPSLMTV